MAAIATWTDRFDDHITFTDPHTGPIKESTKRSDSLGYVASVLNFISTSRNEVVRLLKFNSFLQHLEISILSQ